MRVLWITPKWTLPSIDGARVATEKLLTNTYASDIKIDYLCFGNQDDIVDIENMKKSWDINEIFSYRRELPASKFAKLFYYLFSLMLKPKTPLTFSSFVTKRNRKITQDILSKSNYDVIVLDGLHLAGVLPQDSHEFLVGNSKVVLRAHNIETDLWDRSYRDEKNFLKKLSLIHI